MPRGDGTGPNGLGPMTGRAAGYCAGYQVPGFMNNAVPGRGFGRGFGWGRGYGRRFVPNYGLNYQTAPFAPNNGVGYNSPNNPNYNNTGAEVTKENEIDYLKNTAQALKEELKAVEKRLDELQDTEE